jgi:hypothetical protein
MNSVQPFMRTVMIMHSAKSDIPDHSPGARNATKRAVNLSFSADVLEATNALKINVSQICHDHFIAAYKSTLDAEGLPLDAWRTF